MSEQSMKGFLGSNQPRAGKKMPTQCKQSMIQNRLKQNLSVEKSHRWTDLCRSQQMWDPVGKAQSLGIDETKLRVCLMNTGKGKKGILSKRLLKE